MPPSSSSTPANATPSSSRLQLAAHSARAQSSAACTAGSDRHTRALVKAGQNVTTVGGRSLDRQVILEVRRPTRLASPCHLALPLAVPAD